MPASVPSLARTFVVVVATLAAAIALPVAVAMQSPPLTVHEWGTFTAIAGPDGQAQQWLPLGGPTDLPCFVETYKNREVKVRLTAEIGSLVDYERARSGLKGTVRMETPVLYFYADAPTRASVSVAFPHGLFTEFYPHADVRQMPSYANILQTQPSFPATISWPWVDVRPGAAPVLPGDQSRSHYYAARETDAAAVQVAGQDEKFLFYRGVAGFRPPIATTLEATGAIRVRNLSQHAMPAVIVYTKRAGRIGYRWHGRLDAGADTVLAAPALDGSLDGLRQSLERTLVAAGLYQKEARAMVETWRDDWFNDGTRVFYFVPAPDVDAILPLTIQPAPAAVVRAFVGRMEVITPESEADVARALATNDAPLLEAYGRWLSPIGERVMAKLQNADERSRIAARLDQIFKSYLARVTACQ